MTHILCLQTICKLDTFLVCMTAELVKQLNVNYVTEAKEMEVFLFGI